MAFSAMRSSLGKVADRLRDNVADVLGDERGRNGSRGGPRGEGLAHNLTLPPLSPQSTSPRTPGEQQQEGDTPPSSREDIAQLLRKLKKRGDVLDRKCTSMREALSLALTCLEDTSSVVEAITGKSLAAFTVPTSTGGGGESTPVTTTTGGTSKSSSSSSNTTTLTTGGGGKGGGVAGAAPPPAFHGDPLLDGIGAGAEFMMTEIKSILRKGKAVASKALSPSQPSQPTTTTAPPSAASDREQFSLLPPFPGRKLDAHSLKTALVAASMATAAAAAAAAPGGRGGGGGAGGVMSSILSPPTSKNTQLAAKLTGQAAQISILTAELTTAQAARADAEAALRALSDTLAAAASSSSTAAAPGTTTTSSSSSSAAASAAAALVEELQGEVAHYRAAVATSGARAEAGELECGRLNALRLSLTASLRASEAAVKEQVGEVERVRREGERAVGEARAREESVKGELERALSRATQAERLAAGNMERLQSDVARLSRELKAAKAAAASASVASASASATAAEASAATAAAASASASASASTSAAGSTASSAGAGAVSSPTPTPQQFAKACKDLSECKDELEDALTRLSLAGGQEAVLKGEVRSLSARLEALQSLHTSGSIPLKYLRAVVMQLGSFCERPWAVSERRALVNVLATMLDFDEEERRRACVPVLSKKQQVVAHLRMLASPESPSSSSSSSSSKGGGGGGVGSPLNLGGSPSLQQQLQQHQGGMEDVPFSPPIQGGGLARAEQNAFRAQPAGQQQQSGGLLGMLGFV